jgi:hypothetical protein
MLGVTNYISTDMSPFPLVWVIPLSLYLISFILVFDKYVQWTSKKIQILGNQYTLQEMMLYVGQPLGTLALCLMAFKGGFDVFWSTSVVMLGFFANALACHGEIAHDRPNPRHLTEYFLLMSVGGMLGGMFNGIIAPVVFQGGVYEYYIVLVVACMVRPEYVSIGRFDKFITDAFPGFKQWVVGQGDEMAKSMGRPAPGTTYLFSFFMDVILGIFILSISFFLRTKFWSAVQNPIPDQWLFKLMKFLGMNVTSVDEGVFPFLQTALTLGPPLIFVFFFAGRPLRFGLATAGMLYGILWLGRPERETQVVLESRRTYFGLLKVMQEEDFCRAPEERKDFILKFRKTKSGEDAQPDFVFNYLMHGTTYHGRNYRFDPKADGDWIKDLSRLSTTYYHRYGPVGAVMERYNWFPGKQNDFSADARLPTALVGQVAASLMGSPTLPVHALAQPWVEPPYATIGLGTGTMASYARPYQNMSFYEIDEVMRRFSLPEENTDDELRFSYLMNAIRRGVNLEMVMGDARLTMQREKDNTNNSVTYWADFSLGKDKQLPAERPYANLPRKGQASNSLYRQKFYKVIVVDAFSSDAIPIHLCTKQAIKLYLDNLADDGVLCMHTSNRHMDLVRPVARIAQELSNEAKDESERVYCKVGKDRIQSRAFFMGHFSSEYVMLYRDKKIGDYLQELFDTHEKLYGEWEKKNEQAAKQSPLLFEPPANRPILRSKVEWYDPYVNHTVTLRNGKRVTWHEAVGPQDRLWTDDYSNILSVVRFHWPWQ